MELMLIGLVLTVTAVCVAGLMVLRAGIRQQDRSASLTCPPPSLAAAIARRVLGLYSSAPAADDGRDAQAEPLRPCALNGKERRAS